METEFQTRWLGADSILYATAHRPWPLPSGQWVMTQTWNDLLFAHYVVAPETIRALVPPELTVDLYQGSAWISVVPFWIKNLRPPGMPPLPVVSQLAELNVRTYVTYDGKPGVFFFSLDAQNLSAVWGARVFFRLPYWHAAMKTTSAKDEARGEVIQYRSKRLHGPKATNGAPEFRGSYWPVAPVRTAIPGSLSEFLSERYCLYSWNRKRLYRTQVHHLPWPLQQAELELETNTMCEPLGISVKARPDIAHFSKSLKVLVWPPERLI